MLYSYAMYALLQRKVSGNDRTHASGGVWGGEASLSLLPLLVTMRLYRTATSKGIDCERLRPSRSRRCDHHDMFYYTTCGSKPIRVPYSWVGQSAINRSRIGASPGDCQPQFGRCSA